MWRQQFRIVDGITNDQALAKNKHPIQQRHPVNLCLMVLSSFESTLHLELLEGSLESSDDSRIARLDVRGHVWRKQFHIDVGDLCWIPLVTRKVV